MSSEQHEREQKLAALEQEVSLLRAREQLRREVDVVLEEALRDRLALEPTLQRLIPLLCRHTGARAAGLRTFDENQQLRSFACCPDHQPDDSAELDLDLEAIGEAVRQGQPYQRQQDGRTIFGSGLDIAGEFFGAAALSLPGAPEPAVCQRATQLLELWCEELDNYLASIASARYKHQIIGEISAALKDPVLDQGILRAFSALQRSVAFEDLVLIYRHEQEQTGATLGYKIIKGGRLIHDSSMPLDPVVDGFMRDHALALINGESDSIAELFQFPRFKQEVLIYGVKEELIIGRLLVATGKGEFNTFDRDLLERFADQLCQRIVDFNREWRYLSYSFSREMVSRLLRHEDYRERFLRPQEHEVAVMFCDITGFTRLSEQVLRTPALIGDLINRWSAGVVNIIWETGGVFDKMVGDCVIGLWGPPFFELSAHEVCRRAAQAAHRIRAFTEALGRQQERRMGLAAGEALGVATGLNFCPLFVGLFGPNDDYTGFSSGMNNTARLQGIARQGEILCMDSFVRATGELRCFGDRRTERVKNVSQPLACYPLLELPGGPEQPVEL